MKSYNSVTDALLAMVANGELTTKQMQSLRDAHESEKAQWRNKMIHVVNTAYDAGTMHARIAKNELIINITEGEHDV